MADGNENNPENRIVPTASDAGAEGNGSTNGQPAASNPVSSSAVPSASNASSANAPAASAPAAPASPSPAAPSVQPAQSARSAQPAQPVQPTQPSQPAQQEPMYGALQSQYPGYDPYIYGKPDPPSNPAPARNQGNGQPVDPFAAMWGQGNSGQNPNNPNLNNPNNPNNQAPQNQQNPNGYGNGYGQPQNPNNYGQNGYGPNQYDPRYGQNPNGYPNNPYPYGYPTNPYQGRGNFNPDDPSQNPWAGRWNTWAILAFISSLFGLPIISLPFAILALYSIRATHTKGKGLAIAAIIITLLDFVAVLVMQHMGITSNEILTWMQSFPGLDTSDGDAKKSILLSSLSWVSQMLH